MPAGIGPNQLALKIPEIESTLFWCKSLHRCDCDIETPTLVVVGSPVAPPFRIVSSAVKGSVMKLSQAFSNLASASSSDADDSLIRRLCVSD